jgi:uncharacterized membrane protein
MTTKESNTKDLKQICVFIYGTYAASVLLQLHEATMTLGIIATMIAVGLTYLQKKPAMGTIYQSHVHFMIRTFWIGTGVYFPIALAVATALIFSFTNMDTLRTAFSSGDPTASMTAIDHYMTANYGRISVITTLSLLPVILWWLMRCWNGYKTLKEGKTVSHPLSWL